MEKLDKLDREILNYLGHSAKISINKLSKLLKEPRHVITYRIKRMKKLKIILRSQIIINYKALGFTEYVLYLRFHCFASVKKELKDFLKNSEYVRWAAEVFPNDNLRATILAKNMQEAEVFLNQLEERFPTLLDYKILPVESFIKTEPYSTKNLNKKFFSKNYKPDKLDLRILKELGKNPEISLLTLSTKIGLSIEAIRKRIKTLFDFGVLLAIQSKIDQIKTGISLWSILLIKLKNFNTNKEKLKKLLKSNFNFGRTRKIFGDWNLELSLSAKNQVEFVQMLQKLEEVFDTDLQAYNLHLSVDKFIDRNIPEILFKDL
jgi:DNA-binding Lrp family transcriptional regulator